MNPNWTEGFRDAFDLESERLERERLPKGEIFRVREA